MDTYYVTRIEEPDFGCEGRPEGQEIKDKVFLKEFAFTEENNKPKGLLNNIKSGLVISTSESNSEYLIEGLNNPIETVVVKGTLGVCGIENVEYININVENEDKYDFIEKYFTE